MQPLLGFNKKDTMSIRYYNIPSSWDHTSFLVTRYKILDRRIMIKVIFSKKVNKGDIWHLRYISIF